MSASLAVVLLSLSAAACTAGRADEDRRATTQPTPTIADAPPAAVRESPPASRPAARRATAPSAPGAASMRFAGTDFESKTC